MMRYSFLGLNFVFVIFSLWVHDKSRVWMARRCSDAEAAARQRSADNPFARVDWIGSVLLPLFLLWRGLPVLGWNRPLEIQLEQLRRPCRDVILIDDLRIYEDGPFEQGAMPDFAQTLPPHLRNIDFVLRPPWSETHDLQRFHQHTGYLVLAPRRAER